MNYFLIMEYVKTKIVVALLAVGISIRGWLGEY